MYRKQENKLISPNAQFCLVKLQAKAVLMYRYQKVEAFAIDFSHYNS